jgi:hypothetical protein
MRPLNARLVLSAVSIALLATPAFAQRLRHRPTPHRSLYDYQHQTSGASSFAEVPPGDPSTGYPNPVTRTGSAEQVQSGAAFDLDRGY